MLPTPERAIDPDDEPWVFVIDGVVDGVNEWHADGSWMLLEGVDPPEEVEAAKVRAIDVARRRRAARPISLSPPEGD